MNDNNSNNGSLVVLVLGGIAIYAIVQIVNAIVAAILVLLMGLVYIALGIVGILALFFVFRYITDKQYGETLKIQYINKIERQRTLHLSNLPEHLHERANEYWLEKQHAQFETVPAYSRLDAALDKTKHVLSTFRRGE